MARGYRVYRRPAISYVRQGREVAGTFVGQHKKRIITVAVVLLVVVSGFGLIRHFGWGNPAATNIDQQAHVAPPPTVEVPQATLLDEARQGFGPWQLQPAFQAGQTAMAMLESSGAVQIGSWTTDINPAEWLKTEPFALQSLTVYGKQVSVTDNHGNTFMVSTMQPFIFENDPGNVYFVDAKHNTWTAPLQTALNNRVQA